MLGEFTGFRERERYHINPVDESQLVQFLNSFEVLVYQIFSGNELLPPPVGEEVGLVGNALSFERRFGLLRDLDVLCKAVSSRFRFYEIGTFDHIFLDSIPSPNQISSPSLTEIVALLMEFRLWIALEGLGYYILFPDVWNAQYFAPGGSSIQRQVWVVNPFSPPFQQFMTTLPNLISDSRGLYKRKMTPLFSGELEVFAEQRAIHRKTFNRLLRRSYREYRPVDSFASESSKIFSTSFLVSLLDLLADLSFVFC
jgi:hypothetical protein